MPSRGDRRTPPRRIRLIAILALTVSGAVLPTAVEAQPADGLRVGLTVGGTSFLGISLEFLSGNRSLEVTVGSWAAQDLAVSIVGRQYFGASSARPVVGAGLWAVLAFPPEGRTGIALVARAPIGIDWNVAGDHFLALDINLNRGLWVRRSDPEDRAPMNHRLVPLPGLAYRWRP